MKARAGEQGATDSLLIKTLHIAVIPLIYEEMCTCTGVDLQRDLVFIPALAEVSDWSLMA